MTISDNVREHPKIVATVIFILSIGTVSFWWGYQKDKKTNANSSDPKKKTASHHAMNGLKWVGIIYAIMLLIALILTIMFSTNYWEWFLYGGDAVSGILQLIIALLGALAN